MSFQWCRSALTLKMDWTAGHFHAPRPCPNIQQVAWHLGSYKLKSTHTLNVCELFGPTFCASNSQLRCHNEILLLTCNILQFCFAFFYLQSTAPRGSNERRDQQRHGLLPAMPNQSDLWVSPIPLSPLDFFELATTCILCHSFLSTQQCPGERSQWSQWIWKI